jgi:hypothetical protein
MAGHWAKISVRNSISWCAIERTCLDNGMPVSRVINYFKTHLVDNRAVYGSRTTIDGCTFARAMDHIIMIPRPLEGTVRLTLKVATGTENFPRDGNSPKITIM